MPKRKVKIKMDDLLEYFEEGSYEVQHFLDIEKGEIITLMEWDEDEKLREEIKSISEERMSPLIVEIPDKFGPIEKKVDPLKELVKRAVGVEIKVG